jgi:hypothetical protein
MVYVDILTWPILNLILTFMQYITWISNNQTAWTLKAAGMGPDPSVQISARPVSQEPMVCTPMLIL